jgi:hypothetical protein
VREHRSADDAQLARRRIEDGVAGDVRGHHVGRELHAGIGQRQRLRQRADQQRLAQAGHAFDEDVPRCQESHQDLVDDGGLPDHRLTDGATKTADHLGRLIERACLSISVLHPVTSGVE